MLEYHYEFGIVPDNNKKPTCSPVGVNDPWIARRLLKLGHVIVDVKPRNKGNDSKTRFVFAYDDTLHEDLKCLKMQRRNEWTGVDSNE